MHKVAEGTGNFGYNAATGEYGDMVEMGILDPTKVTRSALQNACVGRGSDDHHRGHDRRRAEGRRPGHAGRRHG
jgi:hypothetical protein